MYVCQLIIYYYLCLFIYSIYLQATPDMLAKLVYESKILFLRSREPSRIALDLLVESIAPGFTNNSKTKLFLKSKIGSYFADYRSRLNTEARAYAEDYINNNR